MDATRMRLRRLRSKAASSTPESETKSSPQGTHAGRSPQASPEKRGGLLGPAQPLPAQVAQWRRDSELFVEMQKVGWLGLASFRAREPLKNESSHSQH
jgi:hypothetical protein